MPASEPPPVGPTLRALRLSRSIAGQQLAQALNWSNSKLSRIEQGKIGISVHDLASALEVLGAPPDVRADILTRVAGDLGVWTVRASEAAPAGISGTHPDHGLSQLAEYRIARGSRANYPMTGRSRVPQPDQLRRPKPARGRRLQASTTPSIGMSHQTSRADPPLSWSMTMSGRVAAKRGFRREGPDA